MIRKRKLNLDLERRIIQTDVVYDGKECTIVRMYPGFRLIMKGRNRQIYEEMRVDRWTVAVKVVLELREMKRIGMT